jgi:hypothetical protein
MVLSSITWGHGSWYSSISLLLIVCFVLFCFVLFCIVLLEVVVAVAVALDIANQYLVSDDDIVAELVLVVMVSLVAVDTGMKHHQLRLSMNQSNHSTTNVASRMPKKKKQ